MTGGRRIRFQAKYPPSLSPSLALFSTTTEALPKCLDYLIRVRQLGVTMDSSNKYFFRASNSLCYFDGDWNVYREDGTLLSGGSFDFESNEILSPNFSIDEVPYWFLENGLLSQDTNGTLCRIQTWRSEQHMARLDHYQTRNGSGTPQDDVVASQPSLNHQPHYDYDSVHSIMPVSGRYRSTPEAAIVVEDKESDYYWDTPSNSPSKGQLVINHTWH
ncbi:unnamed protein product [Rhizoctonia solani]|uniref:Uncharacterized protein n=1 Tax=Rhizoctonia solani TaxID=456999 RepID=A0A8H3GPJ7_9AGAM|nr:unnamed protein product [Rhizoctonia solani]